MLNFIKQYRKAILFLVVFIGLYFLLNTIYGIYINYYYPGTDSLTLSISKQVVYILSVLSVNVNAVVTPDKAYTTLYFNGAEVINIFEGCNGLNIMIVYFSFILAFSGKIKSTLSYLITGIILLYILNLLRVIMLFGIAFHFPNYLYFFHKYLFTGILYLFVFILWFFWINRVKKDVSKQHEQR